MKPIDNMEKNEIKSFPMRSTKQRSMILEVLKGTKTHPTAGWVYEQVKEHYSNISLGTIYRNLNLLKDNGIIKELKFGKNTARYDANSEHHHHIFCLECGKLEDVKCTVHPDLTKTVEEENGYKIVTHQLEFSGICPDCLNNSSTENRGTKKRVEIL
jgi:Fur family peroxide stress response transcriptional regulator